MAEKKFVKGLFKDTGHIDQPEGTWRYALNAFLNDKEGSISNEGGTWPDGILPDADTPGHPSWNDAEYFAVIGTINVNEDRVVLFLKDTRPETVTFYPQSMIVIWEGTEKNTVGYTNGIKILYSDYLLWSNNLKPLNFSLDNRIEGTFKIDSRQDLIIYWTDDLNPPRTLNISRQERAFGIGFIGYYRIYGVVVPGPHFDHIDLLNLFPNSGPIPHIDFFTTYDNPALDNGDQQSVTTGGGLLTGVYYLALAYTDIDFVSTNFLTVSNPVSIVTEYDHTRPTFRKDGAKDGSQTSKAINWKVSNLNTDYKYLKPVVIRKMGDAVDAYRLNDIDVSVAAVEGVVFSGIEGFVKASIEDVIIDTVSYETAKTINQLDGVLYLGNLTGDRDLGYQKYANNIKLTAVVKKIEKFDEFWATTDNLQTGFQSRPVDNGNYVDDSKSYRFDPNIFKYKGYMRDETYAFYIAFIMKDGSMSYAYHIPGREALSISDELDTMSSSAVPHAQSLGEISKQYAKKFHFFDNSVGSANNMNYWENATEFYPDTENYEVWDGVTQLADLKLLNVRHHHFPSNENNDFQTITDHNITTDESTGTSGTMPPINGRIVMVHRCKTWQELYLGAGYCSGNGFYFPNTHSATTLSSAMVSTLISHSSNPNQPGGCNGCGNGRVTKFTANQPMTVRIHYLTYLNRSCSNNGGTPTLCRIESNSSLTTMGATERQEDSLSTWSAGSSSSNCWDTNYNSSMAPGGTSVIQLLAGESVWINGSSSASKPRQAYSDGGCPSSGDSGYNCNTMDNAWSDFKSSAGFTAGAGNHSAFVIYVESGPPNLSSSDLLDAKISHDVQRLGFKLGDIKVPKSIADKVQGFRIFYAKRSHANKTILGQSTLNPMYLEDDYLGRCEEVMAFGGEGGLQAMGQLQSLPELFWSKDAWPRDPADYPLYNIPNNTSSATNTHGYKSFAFHDFTLLRTKNSIAAATHIKPIYKITNLAWNGPGLEQERKMLSYITGAGSGVTPVTIKEFWGWDEPNDEQNCYVREVLSGIFMGGIYNNMKYGSANYEYPRLIGQKAKLYLNGDSIFKGQHLGFGGKIFNEFGESCMTFSLKDQHELTALSCSERNGTSTNTISYWGYDLPGAPAVLVNPDFDTNTNHANRFKQYLVNLHAFKSDLYKSIDTQKLIWTGFEVIGDDLENYVFDDTTGAATYGGDYRTQTTHPNHIWGGDTFINRHGYVSSLTPNNESTKANPKRSIYYQIIESQDNINFRHFESEESIYFPGTPAKTLLEYAGTPISEGNSYDYTRDKNIKYNDNYSEMNDLRTAFPLPLRETKQTDFPTRTHRSAKADPTSLIDNWRMFLANNYKDLPKNRGDLWKLSTFNNLLYFHMEESLFAAKGKQSMSMKDGSEAFVGSGDIFQQDPDELIQTKSGYGGTQSQWAAITTRNGYFFVDRFSRKVFLMKDKLTDISLLGMESWFREHLEYRLEQYGLVDISDNPLTGFGLHSTWDPKYKRIILTKKELVPTATFIASFNAGTVRYSAAYKKFEQYTGGVWVRIEWTNSNYFERSGWTISYLPDLNIWASFHSYVPYLYFNTSTNFYSLSDTYIDYINGIIHSDGVSSYNATYGAGAVPTNYGMAAIWKHNERYKGLIYMDYDYNTTDKYSFEFEYIQNEVKTVAKTFYNISYTLQNFAYNVERNAHDINVLKHGFTDYFIYNTHQIYTTTGPNVPNGLEYLVNVRSIGSEWKINGFRDMARLSTQNTAGGYYMSTNPNVTGAINTGTLTTLQTEKIIDFGYINSIAGLTSAYTENLNTGWPSYINVNKVWSQQRKFTDKWAGIRLIYNNIENNLLNLYSTEVGSRKYYR
jgi:hypothetical protein